MTAGVNQPCPGILQVELMWTQYGEPTRTVLHVQRGTATDHWTQAQIDAVLEAFYTPIWASQWSGSVGPETILNSIVGTDLTDLSGLKRVRAVSPPEPGDNANHNLPNNVTIAIKENPATRGRGTSGRVFWPGIPSNAVVNEQITSGYADSLILVMEAIQTTLGALTPPSNLVVLSRYLGTAKRVAGIGKPITSFSFADLYIDSARTRLPLHKKHKKKRTP